MARFRRDLGTPLEGSGTKSLSTASFDAEPTVVLGCILSVLRFMLVRVVSVQLVVLYSTIAF